MTAKIFVNDIIISGVLNNGATFSGMIVDSSTYPFILINKLTGSDQYFVNTHNVCVFSVYEDPMEYIQQEMAVKEKESNRTGTLPEAMPEDIKLQARAISHDTSTPEMAISRQARVNDLMQKLVDNGPPGSLDGLKAAHNPYEFITSGNRGSVGVDKKNIEEQLELDKEMEGIADAEEDSEKAEKEDSR